MEVWVWNSGDLMPLLDRANKATICRLLPPVSMAPPKLRSITLPFRPVSSPRLIRDECRHRACPWWRACLSSLNEKQSGPAPLEPHAMSRSIQLIQQIQQPDSSASRTQASPFTTLNPGHVTSSWQQQQQWQGCGTTAAAAAVVHGRPCKCCFPVKTEAVVRPCWCCHPTSSPLCCSITQRS